MNGAEKKELSQAVAKDVFTVLKIKRAEVDLRRSRRRKRCIEWLWEPNCNSIVSIFHTIGGPVGGAASSSEPQPPDGPRRIPILRWACVPKIRYSKAIVDAKRGFSNFQKSHGNFKSNTITLKTNPKSFYIMKISGVR